MEQLKYSRTQYCIGLPTKRVGARLRKIARNIKYKIARKIFGYWWCYGCEEYHSGRVVAFWLCTETDGCCSLHLTPEEIANCEMITVGGSYGTDITEQIKTTLQEGQQ